MLSGVAPDSEVMELTKRLSTGEIVRMMELVQQTVAGFNRSAGRRMDAELCIVELCRPELSLDASALNARLTRLEDQLKSGAFVAAPKAAAQPEAQTEPEEELPPIPDDSDAPPDAEAQQLAPVNSDSFWLELVGEIRQELSLLCGNAHSASPRGAAGKYSGAALPGELPGRVGQRKARSRGYRPKGGGQIGQSCADQGGGCHPDRKYRQDGAADEFRQSPSGYCKNQIILKEILLWQKVDSGVCPVEWAA